jgi:WD40 repeat protein
MDVKDLVRQELQRLEPSPGALEKTIQRVQRRRRNRRLGAVSLGLALSALLATGLWAVVESGHPPAPGPASRSSLDPGTIFLPGGSLLPEGALVVQTASGAEVLRGGESQSELIGADLTALDLSHDGKDVLAETNGQLVAVNLSTGMRSALVQAPNGEVFGAFAKWSPDGAMAAFSEGAFDPARGNMLCVVETSTRSVHCFPELGRVYSFDWSPDSKGLLVAGPPAEPLHTVEVADGRITTLFPQQGDSPIARAIAAHGWGEAIQLVDPIWSPSGRYIAALANLKGSDLSYVPVVFSQSGQPVAFGQPSSEFPEPLAWSPTQDVLSYAQGEAPYRITEVRLLDPTSGKDRALVSSDGKNYPIVTDVVWSPSGDWLAVTLWRPNGGEGNLDLRILDVANPGRFSRSKLDAGNEPLVSWRL